MSETLGKLGSAVKPFVDNMIEGKQGSSAFNSSLNQAGDAAMKMGAEFGPLGAAIGAAVKVLTFFVSAVNEQADALYKANQDFAKAGAVGSGGMTEIYNNMKDFGYGIKELGEMTTLLQANGQTLAKFNGTAADGTKNLAKMALGIKESGLQGEFMNMGLGINDINAGLASYASQQAAVGKMQTESVEKQTQQAAEYIQNLSTLSKLTGKSADALAKEQEHALTTDSFAAMIESWRGQGEEGNRKANEAQAGYSAILARGGQEMADAYAAQMSGMVGQTKASNQLSQATGFASNTLINQFAAGKISYQEMVQGIGVAANATKSMASGMYKVGAGTEQYGKAQAVYGLSTLKNYTRESQNAANQTADAAAGVDKLTDEQTKLRQQQMDARDAMQDMLQSGILPVTEGLEGLASVINHIVHPFGDFDEKGRYINPEKTVQATTAGGVAAPEKFAEALSANASDVDKVMATIRQRESGGNYAAQAKGSSASGAYQFIDSTWQSLTKKAGIGQEYKSAKLAPKEIQDQIAKTYVQDILKQSGGDVSKVPLAWYTGNIQGKMSQSALAANNGLTPEKYQANWLKDYAKVGGSNTLSGAGENKPLTASEKATGYSGMDTWSRVKSGLANAGEGAVEGTVIGGIAGGPAGALIGAVSGAVAGVMFFGNEVHKVGNKTKDVSAELATAKDGLKKTNIEDAQTKVGETNTTSSSNTESQAPGKSTHEQLLEQSLLQQQDQNRHLQMMISEMKKNTQAVRNQ